MAENAVGGAQAQSEPRELKSTDLPIVRRVAVKGFGFTNLQTGMIVAIPAILALFTLVWWGRRSDARKERYGHAALANMIGGMALLSSMLLQDPVARIAAVSVSGPN